MSSTSRSPSRDRLLGRCRVSPVERGKRASRSGPELLDLLGQGLDLGLGGIELLGHLGVAGRRLVGPAGTAGRMVHRGDEARSAERDDHDEHQPPERAEHAEDAPPHPGWAI